MANKTERCEACEQAPVMYELLDVFSQHDRTTPIVYRICANCLIGLVNTMLRPEQYFNLLKNGHSPDEFWIHDDFYDENGNAVQPLTG